LCAWYHATWVAIESRSAWFQLWAPPDGAVGSSCDQHTWTRTKFAPSAATWFWIAWFSPAATSTPRSTIGCPLRVSTKRTPEVVTHGFTGPAPAGAEAVSSA